MHEHLQAASPTCGLIADSQRKIVQSLGTAMATKGVAALMPAVQLGDPPQLTLHEVPSTAESSGSRALWMDPTQPAQPACQHPHAAWLKRWLSVSARHGKLSLWHEGHDCRRHWQQEWCSSEDRLIAQPNLETTSRPGPQHQRRQQRTERQLFKNA